MSSNERSSPKSPARGTSRRAGMHAIPTNTTQDQSTRHAQYYSQYEDDEDDLLMEDDPDASNPPRFPSSTIRWNRSSPPARQSSRESAEAPTRRVPSYVPPRRTQKQDPGQIPPPPARPNRSTTTSYPVPPVKKDLRNMHWLLYVGMGMIILLVLWVIGASALAWGKNQYDNIAYGYPRTFQIDIAVGHNDSATNLSHFMALNLHGQVIIFELPGGDPSKAIDYTGPDLVGPGDDQIPVTLEFKDVNHDGKLDMIVHIADRTIVFLNNGTKFVPPPANTNQQTP